MLPVERHGSSREQEASCQRPSMEHIDPLRKQCRDLRCRRARRLQLRMSRLTHAKTTRPEAAGHAPKRSRQPGRVGPQVEILALQRAAGNWAVSQLLQSVQLPLQPKLDASFNATMLRG